MSYTPTEWKNGDTITAEKLNKIEEGIGDGGFIKHEYNLKNEWTIDESDIKNYFLFSDIIKCTIDGTTYNLPASPTFPDDEYSDDYCYGAIFNLQDGWNYSEYPFAFRLSVYGDTYQLTFYYNDMNAHDVIIWVPLDVHFDYIVNELDGIRYDLRPPMKVYVTLDNNGELNCTHSFYRIKQAIESECVVTLYYSNLIYQLNKYDGSKVIFQHIDIYAEDSALTISEIALDSRNNITENTYPLSRFTQ